MLNYQPTVRFIEPKQLTTYQPPRQNLLLREKELSSRCRRSRSVGRCKPRQLGKKINKTEMPFPTPLKYNVYQRAKQSCRVQQQVDYWLEN